MKCYLDFLYESLSVSVVDFDVEWVLGIVDFYEIDFDFVYCFICEDVLL